MFDFKQLQKLQEEIQNRLKQAEDELAEKVVEASSGGGVVVASANGNQEIISIKINPEAVDPEDIEMLQDLVIAAVNSALEKSKKLREEIMGRITGGFGLPNLPF
ncbi:MAG: YbaB/EbfC family nucleoid-associated protein [Candidatus Sumerlaeia bacterium]|nr:YbaB/EbfC family nucleoid-associated protein [Candidatus Sumerlaeia bacterium]